MQSVDVLDKLSLGVCDVGGFVKLVLVGYIIRGEVSICRKLHMTTLDFKSVLFFVDSCQHISMYVRLFCGRVVCAVS